MLLPAQSLALPRGGRDRPSAAELVASRIAILRRGGEEEWSGLITWVEAEAGRLRETRADAGMVALIARRALISLDHPRIESNGRSITRNGRTIVERPRAYRRLRGVEWRRLRESLERIYDERDRGGW